MLGLLEGFPKLKAKKPARRHLRRGSEMSLRRSAGCFLGRDRRLSPECGKHLQSVEEWWGSERGSALAFCSSGLARSAGAGCQGRRQRRPGALAAEAPRGCPPHLSAFHHPGRDEALLGPAVTSRAVCLAESPCVNQ